MERNWCWNGKTAMMDVTPFLRFESTGDSEEVKAGAVHRHDHDDEEAAMDESKGVFLRFDDVDDVDDEDDDDAQSCSYDHSSYINTSYGDSGHDQTQGLIHDDHHDEDDDDVDNDDDRNNNWGESNMTDLSLQQKRSHNYCVDSPNQREIDRKFWETCLAS